jgi:hypothetical protein
MLNQRIAHGRRHMAQQVNTNLIFSIVSEHDR